MNATAYGYFRFLTELVAAAAIFCFPLKRRKLFWLRLIVCLGVSYGFSRIYSYELSLDFFYTVFRYIMLFTLVCATIYVCFDVPVKAAVFCGISAYAVQFFTNKLYVFIEKAVLSRLPFGWIVALYVVITLACYIVFYFAVARRTNKKSLYEISRNDLLICYAAIIVVTIIINVILTMYVNPMNLWGSFVIAVYGMICAAFILGLQSSIFSKRAMQNEIREMEYMHELERKQMEYSKTTMELINIKCHDMKNMIASYGKLIPDDAANELSSRISVYDMSVKTGNATLDLVIAEKSLYMEQQKIAFSCMADGAALDFMSKSDIYSLLGNALSNAVEASAKLVDESRRAIGLNIKRSHGMILIHIENYYDGVIEYADGLPITTKGNADHHGFGTRSIKYITEKYGGTMSVNTEGGKYVLDIAFVEAENNND